MTAGQRDRLHNPSDAVMSLLTDVAIHDPADDQTGSRQRRDNRGGAEHRRQRNIRQPVNEDRLKELDPFAVQPNTKAARNPNGDRQYQQQRVL